MITATALLTEGKREIKALFGAIFEHSLTGIGAVNLPWISRF